MVRGPLKRLAWLKAAVPVNEGPSVTPPVLLPHAPVWARFPEPVTVSVLPLSARAENESDAPAPRLAVPEALRVAVLNTGAALPPIARAPPANVTLRFDPMA